VTRNPELVDATDLDVYAERRPREAQELLPHLVRRLLANTPGVTGVSVRTGSSIGMTGYDGQAHGGTGTGFVPAGPGVWELGTSGNPRKKAQEDYRARTDHPLGIDRGATAFIVVSLRKWEESDRHGWLTRRKKEGIWRTVVALDADDLDGWLDETPAVRIWASEQMGRRPRDVATLELWWQHWAGATRPALPAALLLSGRQPQAERLVELLTGACAVHGVSGPSQEEALAFVAAALLPASPDTPAEGDLATPVLIVSSPDEWGRLVDSTAPTVLIPAFPSTSSDAAAAVRGGHHVVIPMGLDEDPARASISLPRIARDEGRDALLAEGWSREDADRDAAQARRSLQSLRRDPRFAVSPQFERPPWSRRPAADVAAPLVLVGSWQSVDAAGEPSSADRAIVAQVANVDYEALERDLDEWVRLGDPPLHRSGRGWRLAAPVDAWALLRRTLSTSDLTRWSAAALEVLSEIDPVLALPPDERFYAGVRGVHRTWSGRLRRGFAQGTAILGAAGDERVGGRDTAQEHADRDVYELLSRANADSSGRIWQSLSDVLPLLAEAAPDQFLDAVVSALSSEPPLLAVMFDDSAKTRGFGSSSTHTGLLWALETLCWSPTYLSRAVDALSHLAEVDPGGRLSNRPPDSLRRVFLPWHPCTAAAPERRLDVLGGLAERRPAVAFPLLLSLLPVPGSFTHSTASPRFRDWRPDTESVSLSEQLRVISDVIGLVLRMLRQEPSRWVNLISVLHGLPADQFAHFLDAVEQLPPDGLPDDVRLSLWNEVTELVARHRQFPEARWVYPDETLGRFEAIADQLEPLANSTRYARLFDWHPDLPGVNKYDHSAYDEALRRVQRDAVTEAFGRGGLDALLALAAASKLPRLVGAVTAESDAEGLEHQILGELGQDGHRRELAVGWVMRMAELRDSDWRAETAASLSAASEEARATFLYALPVDPLTWSLVDAETDEVQEQYWKYVRTIGIASKDVEALAERLLERKRPWTAIDLLALHLHGNDDRPKPTPGIIEQSLRAALEPNLSETLPPGSLDYDIGVLLDRLAAAGTNHDTMIELEWAYFPLLEHTREPQSIYERLADDPGFFVEAVCYAYRAKSETQPPAVDEATQARALQCTVLLRSWRRLPGTQKDGTVDAIILGSWVRHARELLRERDRMDIGDECLGELLSGSPQGADGAWPCEAVRSLIEATPGSHLEIGLEIGRFNSRGITTRGLLDGGSQEVALAQQYQKWADAVGDRSPKTGRLLRRLAETYARDARREDESSERAGDED
jgi:hypothetical protein